MNVNKIANNAITSIASCTKTSKLIGLDYSDIDTFMKSDFSKSAICVAAKEGKLTQDMIEQMILERLPRTIKQAELFSIEHPELSKEDVIQDLIEHMIKLANAYKGQSNGNFNNYSLNAEKKFLQGLLKAYNQEADYITSNADLSQITDDYATRALRACKMQGLSDAIDTLTIKQQAILEKRFGLDGDGAKTLEEVAKIYDTTRERIRQVENKAIRRMRHPARTRLFRQPIFSDLQDKMAFLVDKDALIK